MSTGDDVVPGNNGLKDQAMVIQWVHDHIATFGGNASEVTLIGHSAGGASVQFHMMSPLTRPLFHRGISLSGTGFNYWSFSSAQRSKELVKKLARRMRCRSLESASLLRCFRNKNPVFLVSNQFNLLVSSDFW